MTTHEALKTIETNLAIIGTALWIFVGIPALVHIWLDRKIRR